MDLVVPEDTDHVAVYVALLRDGRRINQPPAEVQKVSEATFSFVASLVLESREANDRVQVRFVAYDAAGNVRTMREARASIPSDGTRLLRLPLLWINDGLVTGSGAPLATASAFELATTDLLDVTDDVFARLSDGCPSDSTRGNDGLCQPIEVDVAALPDLEGRVAPPLPTCFDLAACFEGSQVETFELSERVGCELPIQATASTEKPALVLVGPRTTGFPLARPSGAVTARPIDDALYRYDVARSVLLFGEALCAKIERDGITTAIVSAKCAPKVTDAPVCGARKQESAGSQPTNAGIFVDEGSPEGGPPDAGVPDGETEPPLPPSPIAATVPVAENSYIDSFTARGGMDGKLWIAGATYLVQEGRDVAFARVAPFTAPSSPLEIDVQADGDNSRSAKLVVDRTGEAFYIRRYEDQGRGVQRSLGLGVSALPSQPLRFCPVGGCAEPADASACRTNLSSVAVGDQEGETVLLVASDDTETSRVTIEAAVRRGSVGGCFEPRTSSGVAHSFQTGPFFTVDAFYPAVSVDGQLVAGLDVWSNSGASPSVLAQASSSRVNGINLPPLVEFQHVAALGEGRTLVTSRVPHPSGEGEEEYTDITLFEPGFPAASAVRTTLGLNAIDEAFGVPNVACLRGLQAQHGSRIGCVVRTTTGELETVVLRLSARLYDSENPDAFSEFDPHVYSDERYLYVGQYCGAPEHTFDVRGVRWQDVQTRAQLERAFTDLCGGDIRVRVE